MRLVLCGVQSPINIGMILRSAEIYRVAVLIHDAYGVFSDKGKVRTISDFGCGALQRHPPSIVKTLSVSDLRGRLVRSDTVAGAQSHLAFEWQAGDSLLIGNEYDGVPQDLAAASHASVTIPMPPGHFPKPESFDPIDSERAARIARQGMPSLNTAVAASAMISAAYARGLLG
ncbi:MAG: hypothetical protein JJ926_10370 [Roseitalea sp.]|jgi:tRNA G18 (ribose-2'-O)-methylase SpoU|uniref:tRNA/rRNA methyltransferase SpoU type domain-containing protein n=1 Tax=Oceaniradius stylonematis TaxID=2184161 RepID=A0A3A8A5X6_9HYPH|nr:TrmH family RNA methyltransferase [Oceaniradius stylonematis]MBO6551345.1 hypothetical protein [Roseitalea sp.]MBO6952275.1 hypothetical protein [Rhizobiaceae bacterium]RNC90699.1 MAG: hypothetical protein ED558_17030 [Oricola sp.]MBO6591879.1 hypothetical protein [Roseitalea sp.]MBO6598134.1 hypothetical protein [Roseitalea sp.]